MPSMLRGKERNGFGSVRVEVDNVGLEGQAADLERTQGQEKGRKEKESFGGRRHLLVRVTLDWNRVRVMDPDPWWGWGI